MSEGEPRTRAWLGAVVGGGLLAAAAVTVALQHETIGAALGAVRRPDAGMLALLAGAILVNLVLTGLTFSVLMSQYGRVGRMEMQALIAAASLLNFLPLRPGLFGRIAYHKTVHGIRAVDSAKAAVSAIVLSAAVAACLAAALAVTSWTTAPLWVTVAAPLPVLAAATAPAAVRVWAAAALLRYLEVIVWAARYYAAFALIGSPVGADSALAFGCVSMVVMLVPLVGNGLGLREWAIGLAAPLLSPYDLGMGLSADLLNRATELVVIGLAGLVGFAWLSRRKKAMGDRR